MTADVAPPTPAVRLRRLLTNPSPLPVAALEPGRRFPASEDMDERAKAGHRCAVCPDTATRVFLIGGIPEPRWLDLCAEHTLTAHSVAYGPRA